jgi:hypothetical protein
MANFIQCKQESYSYKDYNSTWVKTGTKRVLLFFKKEVGEHRYLPGKDIKIINKPINLEVVQNLVKYDRVMEWNSPESHKNEKKGIRFDLIEGQVDWFFDSEKVRDEQYNEIVNNTHLFLNDHKRFNI